MLWLPTALPLEAAEPARNNPNALRRSSISDVLDSLVNATYFKDEYFTAPSREGGVSFPSTFVPQFSDSVYSSRIAALRRKTPMPLVYNAQVKGYIRMYAVEKRSYTAKILGLTKIYFPLFEEKFDTYNVPLEMKYLAIVESALNPTAVSPAGAKGLWQFMYGTGKMYGLESSSFIEDRYDPYKSSVAAARHLRDLYQIYGDWFLALAAYNAGPGNVNKAIRRAGGVKDYWAIWDYLPAETRGYVPAFIAVHYIMSYHNEHNIRPLEPAYLYRDIDTLRTSRMVTFEQISETLGISASDLEFLNPQYKIGVIPASTGNGNVIRLPRRYVAQFQRREQEIYAYRSARTMEREALYARLESVRAGAGEQSSESSKGMGNQKIHIVQRGETLGSVARLYRTYISQLIAWNNLVDADIMVGQRLVVFGGEDNSPVAAPEPPKSTVPPKAPPIERQPTAAPEVRAAAPPKRIAVTRSTQTVTRDELVALTETPTVATDNTSAKAEPIFHVVEPGQTLFAIATQRKVTVNQLMLWNNLKSVQIKAGQKLIVSSDGQSGRDNSQ
uniref:Peptidoglycan-binding LysM n=1 Tax=Chlorobium chlorochromatii (strain CaD3) TaxID=340177 RepID=Q3AQT8_CHLCH